MVTAPDKQLGYKIGTLVGLVFGSIFIWANQATLPSISRISSIVLWVVLAAAVAWAVWFKGSQGRGSGSARPNAMRVYGISCLLMVVGFFVVSRILASIDAAHAMPAAVAMIVGLHFLPFSSAFQVPFFAYLGWALTAIGLAGLVLAIAVGAPWGAGAAVTAGIVMIGLQAWDGISGLNRSQR